MLKITLKLKGEEKTYTKPFIDGFTLKNTFRLQKELKQMEDEEEIFDNVVGYIVSVFDNQFTEEEFLRGYEGNKIFDLFEDTVNKVIGKTVNKIPSPEQ